MTWITLDPPLPFSKASHASGDPVLRGRYPEIPRGFKSHDWNPEQHAAYQETNRRLNEELAARRTFTSDGLNRPGVQFELVDGRRFLIGDLCPDGDDAGHEDIFYSFDINALVARYRVLDIS